MFDLTHTYFPYLVSISSCFVASRHQSRRSPTFYSLKLLKTKKQTNKQPKISQTEWCRYLSYKTHHWEESLLVDQETWLPTICSCSISFCFFFIVVITQFQCARFICARVLYLLSTCLPVKRVHLSWPFHLSACDCSTLSMWVGGGGVTSFTWGWGGVILVHDS